MTPARRHVLIALAAVACIWTPINAAANSHDESRSGIGLRSLLDRFVRDGITLAPPATGFSHAAHFISGDSPQLGALSRVSREIARQVSSVQLASSAGGFAYAFDPALGTMSRPSRSFGAVYSERPLTVGRGKFNVGFSYSSYSFDTMDNLRLRDGEMQLVFTHEDTDESGNNERFWFEGDVIRSDLSLSIRSDVATFVATYGLADRIDLGLAVPVISVDLEAFMAMEIERLATGATSDIHVFPNGTSRQSFRTSGTASGVGDVLFRAKGRLVDSGPVWLGLIGDLRLPTGDADNLLGTGETQGRASLAASWSHPSVSPHASAGYGVAGGGLPAEVTYAIGIDFAADSRMTIAADLLGLWTDDHREVFVVDEVYTFNTAPSGPPVWGQATLPSMGYREGTTANSLSGSVGMKLNVFGNVLLTLNGRFPLTDIGLQDSFTPLIGIDYSF